VEISLRCIYALGGVSVVRKLGGEVLVDVVWGLGGGGVGVFFLFFLFFIYFWGGGGGGVVVLWSVEEAGGLLTVAAVWVLSKPSNREPQPVASNRYEIEVCA